MSRQNRIIKISAIFSTLAGLFAGLIVFQQTARAVEPTSDLIFVPDPGVRMDDASNPGARVNPDGSISLLYTDKNARRDRVATSQNGLVFSSGIEANAGYFRAVRLSDGTYRAYIWDPQQKGLTSQSSKDGITFTKDAGVRYTLQENDRGEMGVYDLFLDSKGGVTLLYIGDMHGLNSVRRAYSSDGGWIFVFDKNNVLGDESFGGGPQSYIDEKSIKLPDGRIRLITMKQGRLYSFISNDDGKTFTQEAGTRLSSEDFKDAGYTLFNDPQLVRLQDGKYRIYVTAVVGNPIFGALGEEKSVIVSATTQAQSSPTSQTPSLKSTVFTRTLQKGSSGPDVTKLQEFLKTPPVGGPDVYPEGLVTGYFGVLTEKAVKRYQAKFGLEQVGIVGPKTRAKLNGLGEKSTQGNTDSFSKPAVSFYCPDEMRIRGGLQTLAITNGVTRPLAKDEQDWITQNCPATQGAQGQGWTYNQSVTEKLPSCVGNTLLSVSPIDPSLVKRLIPLGHIGTPHHAVPMDHMEYVLPQIGDGLSDTITTDIKAAAAMHIIGVRQTIKKVNGVVTDDKYFSIAFTPCKDTLFYFEAMGSISDALKQAVQNAKNNELIASEISGNQETVLKEYRINYVTKPGEVIGTAGGPDYPGKTLDLGAYDFRIPKLAFLGEQIPDKRTSYTVCPIDYFPSPLKDQLYAKFDRKIAPLCGTVMQDLAGTIQGNWKARVANSKDLGDQILMGIVHDNLDPSIGVIAVAGILTNHGSIDFTPEHNGFINREPSEVKADGNIYCYQSGSHKQVSSASPVSGRIVIQLLDDGSLKVEHQEKSCSESFNFSSPIVYQR